MSEKVLKKSARCQHLSACSTPLITWISPAFSKRRGNLFLGFLIANVSLALSLTLGFHNFFMQILNRKAHFEYAIEEEIEAGIMLLGSEVKAVRQGKVSLGESYVAESQGELILINCNINEYGPANRLNHEPKRPRKLLLHKKEKQKIIGKINSKGYSAVPLKMYFRNRFAKVLIGVGRGKKLHDKRESIKQRDDQRRQARGED